MELDSPLGNRQLVDPACSLDRYADWVVCENPVIKFGELRFGSRAGSGLTLNEVKSGVGRRGNRQRRHTALRMRTPIDYERIHYNHTTITPLIQVG